MPSEPELDSEGRPLDLGLEVPSGEEEFKIDVDPKLTEGKAITQAGEESTEPEDLIDRAIYAMVRARKKEELK